MSASDPSQSDPSQSSLEDPHARALEPGPSEQLVDSGDHPALQALAANPSATPGAQLRLLALPELHVHLAMNPSVAPGVQLALAADGTGPVCAYLAKNPTITPTTQAALSRHDNSFVRHLLTRNESFVLSPSLDVGFLRSSTVSTLQDYLAHQTSDLDPATLAALLPQWEGDLESLLVACRSFS